jgi:hypothetical protein
MRGNLVDLVGIEPTTFPARRDAPRVARRMICKIGGPGRDRTDDLFHAMEARSQTAPQAHRTIDSILSDRPAIVK